MKLIRWPYSSAIFSYGLFALLGLVGCAHSKDDTPLTIYQRAIPIKLHKGKPTPLSSSSSHGMEFLEANASATKAKLKLVKLGEHVVWEKWCIKGDKIAGTNLYLDNITPNSATILRPPVQLELDKN